MIKPWGLGLSAENVLHNFNGLKFEAIAAPYPAKDAGEPGFLRILLKPSQFHAMGILKKALGRQTFSLGKRTLSLGGQTFSLGGLAEALGGQTLSLGGLTFLLGRRIAGKKRRLRGRSSGFFDFVRYPIR